MSHRDPQKLAFHGGSTHNIIDQLVVTWFGLPIEQDTKLRVMVANKEQIDCMGKCRALTIQTHGCPITADFRLPLSFRCGAHRV